VTGVAQRRCHGTEVDCISDVICVTRLNTGCVRMRKIMTGSMCRKVGATRLLWSMLNNYGETIVCHGVQTACATQDEDHSLLQEHGTWFSILVNQGLRVWV
jgi:hypothetical protein